MYSFSHGTENFTRPPIVLIHGAGGMHLHWPPQARYLSGQRVYAPDLPGHGRSNSAGANSITDYARAIVDFLDDLELSAALIAGHSMGGAVALQIALDFPERALGLCLVATGAKLRVEPELLNGIAREETITATFQRLNELEFGPEVNPRMKELSLQRMRDIDPQILYADYLACDAFDVTARLGEINTPTLILCGTHDLLTPLKFSEYLRENITGAQLVPFERAGHMLMLEQAEAFTQTLEEFANTLRVKNQVA